MNWQEIPKFTQIHYRVNVPFMYLSNQLNRFVNEYGLDLNPDFQRGHVWTEEQQIAYLEFALKEPQSGKEIYFNHPGWMGSFSGDFVLVDGKQRIDAVLRFLNNEIPVYGCLRKNFTGLKPGQIPMNCEFVFNIAKLQTRAEVLKWYLDFNAGGTPHSKEEISRVRELLKTELAK